MDAVLRALADPTTRLWYLAFCFAVMVLPMIALGYWYHSRINSTPGGRRLMKRQARSAPRPRGSLDQAARNLSDAESMSRDIEAGRYGLGARQMQRRVYWIVGIWVLANVLAFGILLWADEVHRAAG